MIDYEYYYDQYRRVSKHSGNHNNKDLVDYNSIISASNFNFWSNSIKRPMTATCIDGTRLLGLDERPYGINNSFPKGKGRRKPQTPAEKKINTGDVYISLVPAEKSTYSDALTSRSEKTRSPLSMATATHYSTLPDVQRRSADIRKHRIYSATVFDDENSDAKFYGHRAPTTHANGGWIRRYKSINKSQILTNILRDQTLREKSTLRKRFHPQSFRFSSPSKSAFNSSLIKRQLTRC